MLDIVRNEKENCVSGPKFFERMRMNQVRVRNHVFDNILLYTRVLAVPQRWILHNAMLYNCYFLLPVTHPYHDVSCLCIWTMYRPKSYIEP